MTIRRRLGLSFLAIVGFFALNLLIYFWSNQKRSASVETLRQALARQMLVASINQRLSDLSKQVALLSEVAVEAAAMGAGPEAVAQFNAQLEGVEKQIQELVAVSTPEARSKVETFAQQYEELSASWRIFYENFGVRHTKAIVELATRGDPLSQRILQQLVPQLQEEETAGVEAARAHFYQVDRLTDRVTLAIFALSTLLAIGVAYHVSRYIVQACGDLTLGTAQIGAGNLDHRIQIQTRDELGNLAEAFNEMAGNLLAARSELTRANEELERRNQEVEQQRQRSESLLLNILPAQVAAELQTKGTVEPKYFEDVTILFADFVGFTLATEKLAAEDLVRMLHDYFTTFDRIICRYGMEKLKTIGDSYMCVAGLPVRTPSHPVDAVLAGFEMVRAVTDRNPPDAPSPMAVRIGIHSGPVIAGVVGIEKFAFDIWGDTVNYASRMESSGASNRINLSERTYARVKDFFECEHRGKVQTKEKKEFDMYFARGVLPSLVADHAQIPPPAFLRRYRVYFQKDPPAFPAFLVEPASAPSRLLS